MSAIELCVIVYIVMGIQFTMYMIMVDAGDYGFKYWLKRLLWYIAFTLTWPMWLVVEWIMALRMWWKTRKEKKNDID